MQVKSKKNKDGPGGNRVNRRCCPVLSPMIYLMINGLFFTLRLSGGGGSFPRPLKAAEEQEYLRLRSEREMSGRA